jgi:hypothetical protein
MNEINKIFKFIGKGLFLLLISIHIFFHPVFIDDDIDVFRYQSSCHNLHLHHSDHFFPKTLTLLIDIDTHKEVEFLEVKSNVYLIDLNFSIWKPPKFS